MSMSRHDPPPRPRRSRAFTRRDLFGMAARGAGAAFVAPSLLDLLCRQALAQDAARAARQRLVLLWLEGGPSQLDTFDPKPGAPTNGPFKSISTDVKGLLVSEHLPGLAKRASRLAIVRSMTSKEGSHARARQFLHCGYAPNPAVSFPSVGSIVAHELGDLDHDLPAFVQIAGLPDGGGYLGIRSAPFLIPSPTGEIANLSYLTGVDRTRMDRREELRAVLDEGFAQRAGAPLVEEDVAQRRRARRLMDSALRSAFDLAKEEDGLRDAYGRSEFGQGVLLARRLLEHGVAAVEVVLEGWDTHVDNFNRTQNLCGQLDPAFSALLDDLADRGMLDDTLIVCMGEFGRTPYITPSAGRNHWPNNYCVALAGGGIRAGTVLGATDEKGENVVERPVQVADLFATLARALGIDRDREFMASRSRPVKLVDPNGIVVPELLA